MMIHVIYITLAAAFKLTGAFRFISNAFFPSAENTIQIITTGVKAKITYQSFMCNFIHWPSYHLILKVYISRSGLG